MKIVLSQIFFICIVQLCLQQIKSAKETLVTFYEDRDFKGAKFSTIVKEGQCHNLNSIDKRSSSVIYCVKWVFIITWNKIKKFVIKINTGGACLFVYDQPNCGGNWKQISPVVNNHNRLSEWDFNDKIRSVQFCSNFPGKSLFVCLY